MLFLAISTATVAVFGTSAGLKSNIKSSGIYEKAVDGVVSQLKKDQDKKSNSASESKKDEVNIIDPAVQEVIKNAFPASFLESSSNSVIDGFFGWLKGSTETPQFTIDLAESKKQLAFGISEVAYQKALALPVCTVAQLRTLNPNNIDINNLPCRPPGVDLASERNKFRESVANSKEFLSDTTITNEDLFKSDDKNGFDQAGNVPSAYQLLVKLPYILGALGILTGLGVVFLHDERRRGLLIVSRTVLITGIVLLAGVAVSNYIINSDSIIKFVNGSEFEKTARTLASLLLGDFNGVLLMFCIPYMAVGGGGMLALRLTRPKPPEKEETDNPKEPSTSTEPKKDTKTQ